uniref:Protein DEK-like n=1 Tax=Mesocestoides corti TaxID=53468 RepID=A0A5K3FTF7_MESCO
MPGKDSTNRHLTSMVFAALKGYIEDTSSESDGADDKIVKPTKNDRQKHSWLDDDDDDDDNEEGGEEEEEEEEDDESSEASRPRPDQPSKKRSARKPKNAATKRIQRQEIVSSDGDEESVHLSSDPDYPDDVARSSGVASASKTRKAVPTQRSKTSAGLNKDRSIEKSVKESDKAQNQRQKASSGMQKERSILMSSTTPERSPAQRQKASAGVRKERNVEMASTRRNEVSRERKPQKKLEKRAESHQRPSLAQKSTLKEKDAKKATLQKEETKGKSVENICSDLMEWTLSVVPDFKPSEEETDNILKGKIDLSDILPP